MALIARSANNQLGRTTEKWYKNKIQINKSYNMKVAMGVDKRCATSGRAPQVEFAAREIQRMKIHLRKTLQNRKKCINENRFLAISSLHRYANL